MGYPTLPIPLSTPRLHSPFPFQLVSPRRPVPIPPSLPPSPHLSGPSQTLTLSFFPIVSYFPFSTVVAPPLSFTTPYTLLSRAHLAPADRGSPTHAGLKAELRAPQRPRPTRVDVPILPPPEGAARERLVPRVRLPGLAALSTQPTCPACQGPDKPRCSSSNLSVCSAGDGFSTVLFPCEESCTQISFT